MPAETHVEQGPLDRNAIFEIVRDRLADILEIDPGSISEGQSFVDDLDADSLALIELVEALEDLYERLEPESFGGAMLLGVDGVCIISHGSSSAKAVFNAIKMAREMVVEEVVEELRAAVAAG